MSFLSFHTLGWTGRLFCGFCEDNTETVENVLLQPNLVCEFGPILKVGFVLKHFFALYMMWTNTGVLMKDKNLDWIMWLF